MSNDIKVLVVDDSLLTRKVLSDIIRNTPGLKLAGTANDGKFALAKIPFLKPDVITLDVNMPKLDGIATLQEIMKRFPKPVIMVSAVTKEAASETIAALEAGAVDFITKPDSDKDIEKIKKLLIEKIKAASRYKLDAVKPTGKIEPVKIFETPQIHVDTTRNFAKKVVAIGISTGGPKALKEVFVNNNLNQSLSILIVQHMPDTFTGAFATRLNQISNLNIKEAENNDPILEGHVYIAPGHSHMAIEMKSGKPHIKLYTGPKVSGHMPSVDVLFNSVANVFKSKAIGVIMTGMGRDGADGTVEIKNKMGYTISQDEKTSVVFGMNREAINLGSIDKIVPLEKIASAFTEQYLRL